MERDGRIETDGVVSVSLWFGFLPLGYFIFFSPVPLGWVGVGGLCLDRLG